MNKSDGEESVNNYYVVILMFKIYLYYKQIYVEKK